jgi:hypothetical protein
VRRVILVRRQQRRQLTQVIRKQKKCLHVITPPPCKAPPRPRPPSPPPPAPVVEQVFVACAQPPAPKPQSLTLTVTDACCSQVAGPAASTLIQRPLTFTISPQFAPQRSRDFMTYDVIAPPRDVTMTSSRMPCKCRRPECSNCH